MKRIVKRRITGPDAPALGPVLTISDTELTLTLDRPASGPTRIDRYEIERYNGSAWVQIASGISIFGASNQYADTSLTASTAYQYRCRAVDTTERASEYSYSSGTTSSGVANQAPVWTSPINLSLQQGSSVSIASYASDPEGDQLTFAKVASDPNAANIVLVSGPGVLSCTAACPVDVYTLTVSASDGALSTNGTITLTVTAASTGTNWDITTGTSTYDATQVQPGDTITILRGAGTRTPLLIRNVAGTLAAPITIRGDQSGVVTIRRSAPQQNGGFVLEFQNCRHFTVNGYLASGTRNCGIKVMYATGASSGNKDNPSMWVKFSGASTLTSAYTACNNFTVKYVHVDGGYPTYSTLGSAFYSNDLRFKKSNSNYNGLFQEDIVFEYNYVQRAFAQGFYVGPNWVEDSIPLKNITVRYNQIEDTGGTGISGKNWWEGTNAIHGNVILRSGQNLTNSNSRNGLSITSGTGSIYNNWVEDNGADNTTAPGLAQGIRNGTDDGPPTTAVAGYSTYSSFSCDIYNNVVINAAEEGIVINRETGTTPVAPTIFNNTVLDCGTGGIKVTAGDGGFVRNNIVLNSSTAVTLGGTTTAANNLTSGYTQSALFVAPESADYHLAIDNSDTRAVDGSGTDIAATDYEGTSRSGTASKGAFEYS